MTIVSPELGMEVSDHIFHSGRTMIHVRFPRMRTIRHGTAQEKALLDPTTQAIQAICQKLANCRPGETTDIHITFVDVFEVLILVAHDTGGIFPEPLENHAVFFVSDCAEMQRRVRREFPTVCVLVDGLEHIPPQICNAVFKTLGILEPEIP